MAGVAHYLVIDPITKTIEWLELGQDATSIDRSGTVAQSDRLSLTLADGCRVEIDRQITCA